MAGAKGTDERLTIQLLAGIVFVCLVGIIAEDLAGIAGANDALLTIGSLAAGALASRISQAAKPEDDATTTVAVKDRARSADDLEDDFAVIGRAATKSIIAEAMRKMSEPPSDRTPDQSKP